MRKERTIFTYRKCACVILLLIFNSIPSYSQNPRLDSLLKAVTKMQEDTLKVNTLNEISSIYRTDLNDLQNVNKYASEALILSRKLNYKKGIAYSLLYKGIFFWSVGSYETSLFYERKALELMISKDIKQGESSCYQVIGLVYSDLGNYKEALQYMFKGVKIKEQINDKSGLPTGYNNIGNVFLYQANFTEALKYHLKALKIREELGNKMGIAMSYNN